MIYPHVPRKDENMIGVLVRSGIKDPWCLLTSYNLALYKTTAAAVEEAKAQADQWATTHYLNQEVRCAFMTTSARNARFI